MIWMLTCSDHFQAPRTGGLVGRQPSTKRRMLQRNWRDFVPMSILRNWYVDEKMRTIFMFTHVGHGQLHSFCKFPYNKCDDLVHKSKVLLSRILTENSLAEIWPTRGCLIQWINWLCTLIRKWFVFKHFYPRLIFAFVYGHCIFEAESYCFLVTGTSNNWRSRSPGHIYQW